MTYTTVLQKLRFRLRDVKLSAVYGSDGALFTLVNEAARELYRRTRDYEQIATLTVNASQYDYDIPSEIATDVGEIQEIVLSTGNNSLMGKSIKPFNKIVMDGTADSDTQENGVETAPPSYFRVWEDTLRIHPTPSSGDTGTVYYFAREPLIDYSNANLTQSLRIKDDYLEALLTYCKGLVYEIIGDEQKADKKKNDAFGMIEEVKMNRVDYGSDTGVVYHGATD